MAIHILRFVHFGHVSKVCVFLFLLNLDVFQTFVRASRGCKQMPMLVGMLHVCFSSF